MDEYIAALSGQIAHMGLEADDASKVAEAFAASDKRQNGSLDIDELATLLDHAGKPLPGFKIRQILPGVKTATPGEINVCEFAKVSRQAIFVSLFCIKILRFLNKNSIFEQEFDF